MEVKLRLVKVIVKPVFMIDTGDALSEIDHPPVSIPANEWPTYSSERFPRETEQWQKQLQEKKEWHSRSQE